MTNCSLTASCSGGVWTGDGACFVNCCNVSCPNGCDSIEITYSCGQILRPNASPSLDFPECSCSGAPMRYSVSGVSFAPNQHQIESSETKEIELSKAPNQINISDIANEYFQSYDEIKAQSHTNCANVTITINTDGPCGLSYSALSVGVPAGDGCCCKYNSPNVNYQASLTDNLSKCNFYLSWTTLSVPTSYPVGFPQLCSKAGINSNPSDCTTTTAGDKCPSTGFYWSRDPALSEACLCCLCEIKCNTGVSLWKKKIKNNKIIIKLNKAELANRVNKLMQYKIKMRMRKKLQ